MMNYDAFGILHFKNVTEKEMKNIRTILDNYFLEHKVDNIGDDNNFDEYVVHSAVNLNTVKEAVREIYDNHFDKVSYMSILWKESENTRDNDTTSFSHVKRVKLESRPFDNPTEITFKEDILTISHDEGTLFNN